MIWLRNVPDSLRRKLLSRADLAGMSLSSYLIAELQKITERPTMEELRERLSRCEPVDLKESPAEAVRGEIEGR